MVNTQQILNGKVLELKRLGTETEKENVEKLGNKESSGQKESRTVMVSGLPKSPQKTAFGSIFKREKTVEERYKK